MNAARRTVGLRGGAQSGVLGGRSGAADINNSGVIVGWSYDLHGDLHAFVHKDGKRVGFMLKPRVGGATLISAADITKLTTAVKPARTLLEGNAAQPLLEPAREPARTAP